MQRLLENKKRFEDLGISKISKSLSDHSKSEKTQQRQTKPRLSTVSILEPRRSSRARNVVPSYRDDVNIDLPPMRRRSKLNSSWASYLARPLDEVKSATYEERVHAMACAEKLQSNLQSENPFFIKSMVRSHVYSCFWLGLPTWFCEDHLLKSTEHIEIVLEDENGTEYEVIYISKRTGLSGGWRAFALDHKLDDGDALVFELVEPTRFKIYIVKASDGSNQEDMFDVDEKDGDSKKIPTETMKPIKKTGTATKSKQTMNPAQILKRKGKSDDGSKLEDKTGHRGSKNIPTETATNPNKKGDPQSKSKNETNPVRVSARLPSSRV